MLETRHIPPPTTATTTANHHQRFAHYNAVPPRINLEESTPQRDAAAQRERSHQEGKDNNNTAKLSPSIILNRNLHVPGGAANSVYDRSNQGKMANGSNASDRTNRKRRSSSIVYHEPTESIEQLSDQQALPNLNAEWVNAKGAWLIHPILIISLKILFDIVPGITQELSWTLTNITYMTGSYIMFHWVRGIPFDFNSGAYDNLNMWEQIDNEEQFTPTKKYLLSVPIVLFLVSTHYTRYEIGLFSLNLLATVAVVIPKLPALHRLRTTFLSGPPEDR